MKPTYKRRFILALVLFFLVLGGFFFMNNTYFYYKHPIVKIDSVQTVSSREVSGVNGRTETYYTQSLQGRIMNGSHKGETVTLSNEYSKSGVKSESYSKGDALFVTLSQDGGTLKATIDWARRDSYLFFIGGIFLLFLMLVSGRQGLMTLLSLIINVAVFCGCMFYFDTDTFFGGVWMSMVAFFCISTLVLVSGFHKKTAGAVLSTLVTVTVVYGIYRIMVSTSSDLPYEMLAYVITPLPLKQIYMVSVITGMLGAVMDVAITVNASVSEITATSGNISVKSLIISIREIGHDVMGTMINVLFFTYLSTSLPSVILKIHSGYSLGTIVRYEYIFDIVRFLTGALGIVLAIPVSGAIAILLFRRGGKNR